MLTSIRGLAAASFVLSAGLLATPALAEETDPPSDIEVSGNVALVTDYRFRGVSLSAGDPAIQGGIDVSHASGFYIGTWGSSIEGGDAFGEMALIDAVPGDTPVPGDSLSPVAPHRIVNIGNGAPVPLMDFIAAIEQACGRDAIKTFHDIQPGDVPATWADTSLLETLTGKRPTTPIQDGIDQFVRWYRDYYDV